MQHQVSTVTNFTYTCSLRHSGKAIKNLKSVYSQMHWLTHDSDRLRQHNFSIILFFRTQVQQIVTIDYLYWAYQKTKIV